MKANTRFIGSAVVAGVLFGTSVVASGNASAELLSDAWRFRAVMYMWAPKITGNATFPGGGAAPPGETEAVVDITFKELIDHLKMTGMGTLEAQKGPWGAFTDVVYLNVGGTKTTTREGSIDNVPVPVGVTLNTGLDLKTWIWTLAGSYRVQATPESEMDVFVGARMLTVKPRLTYDFSADVGPFTGPGRTGSRSVKETDWNAILGVKGRVGFGSNREWFIPYYIDAGTGDSQLTWQGVAGIGYTFHWGDAFATYRYLHYNFKSRENVDDLTVRGPLLGVALRW
jgi:hypothetical protein